MPMPSAKGKDNAMMLGERSWVSWGAASRRWVSHRSAAGGNRQLVVEPRVPCWGEERKGEELCERPEFECEPVIVNNTTCAQDLVNKKKKKKKLQESRTRPRPPSTRGWRARWPV